MSPQTPGALTLLAASGAVQEGCLQALLSTHTCGGIPASGIQPSGGCCLFLCSLPQRQGLWECTSPRASLLAPLTYIPVILLGTTCSHPCAHLLAAKSSLLYQFMCSAGYTCYFLLSIPCPKYPPALGKGTSCPISLPSSPRRGNTPTSGLAEWS